MRVGWPELGKKARGEQAKTAEVKPGGSGGRGDGGDGAAVGGNGGSLDRASGRELLAELPSSDAAR